MTASGYRYRAPVVDRRYMDWHYDLDRRCSQMDLDSVEIHWRTGAWLALVETTTNPEKHTYWTQWGAQRLNIPAFLVLLPVAIPIGPQTTIRVRAVHWPFEEARPFSDCNGETLLRTWGRYIEQRIHGLPPKVP